MDELDRTLNVFHRGEWYRNEIYPESWLIEQAIKVGLYHYVSQNPDKVKQLTK